MKIDAVLKELRGAQLDVESKIKLTLDTLLPLQSIPDPMNDDFNYRYRLSSLKLISTCLDECCKNNPLIEIHKFRLKGAYEEYDKELYFIESKSEGIVHHLHDAMKYHHLNVHQWFHKLCVQLNLTETQIQQASSCRELGFMLSLVEEYDQTINDYMGEGETEKQVLAKLSNGQKFGLWNLEQDPNMGRIEFTGVAKKLFDFLDLQCWEVDLDYDNEDESERFIRINIDRNDDIYVFKYYLDLRKRMSIEDSREALLQSLKQYSYNRLNYFNSSPIAIYNKCNWMGRIVPNY